MKNNILFFLIIFVVILVTHIIIYGEGFSSKLLLTAGLSGIISTFLFWLLTGVIRKKK